MTKSRDALQKILKEEELSKGDKQSIAALIDVLKKASKGKKLSQGDQDIIKEVITKSESGTLAPTDIINLVMRIFQLADILKDYS